MKKIALILALLGSLSAQAGDFQELTLKVDTCHDLGRYAGQFYDDRISGKPRYLREDNGTHMGLIFQYTIDYAWDKATSKDDAMRQVQAKCMDNYDWAVQNDKINARRPAELHY